MLQKFFYLKFGNSLVHNKKCLNKIVYNKPFVRSNLLNNKEIFVLDNNSDFYNYRFPNFETSLSKEKRNLGYSFYLDDLKLKNNSNTLLTFKSFVEKSNAIYLKTTYIFYCLLKNLVSLDSLIIKSLLILNPVKAGFMCYFNGITGFLPRSHSILLIKGILKQIKSPQSATYSLSFLNMINSSTHQLNFQFILRVPFSSAKISLYPSYKKAKFSSLNNKKQLAVSNDLNFLFLLKQQIPTNILNEKKKVFRIHNNKKKNPK